MTTHTACGCIVCDNERLKAARPGGLYRPRVNKNGTPQWPSYWGFRRWPVDGWSNRFGGSEVFTVLKWLTKEDSPEDFHLHPVLCFSTSGKQFVTSAMWIEEV